MPTHDYSQLDTQMTLKLKEGTYQIDEPPLGVLARIARLASAEAGSLEEAAGSLEETVRAMVPGITERDLKFLLVPRVLARFLRDLSGNGAGG